MAQTKKVLYSSLGILFLVLNLIAMGYIFSLLIPKIVKGINGIVVYLILILIILVVSLLGATIYVRTTDKKKSLIIISTLGIVAVSINIIAVVLIVYSLLVGL